MTKPITLEICIDSFASASAAKAGGADRLEVCSALAVGGTTPSLGLVQQCVDRLGLPVMMMIRPHDGGFVYDRDDIDTMLVDMSFQYANVAFGIVFGALAADQSLDKETCEQIIGAAGDLETTFHRAFDMVPNPSETLAQLEALGVTRILTSGQKPTALAGAPLLRQLTRQAKTIKIVAGSGVNADRAVQLVKQTGVQEIHASASVLAHAQRQSQNQHEQNAVTFGANRRITCAAKVSAIKSAFANATLP